MNQRRYWCRDCKYNQETGGYGIHNTQAECDALEAEKVKQEEEARERYYSQVVINSNAFKSLFKAASDYLKATNQHPHSAEWIALSEELAKYR